MAMQLARRETTSNATKRKRQRTVFEDWIWPIIYPHPPNLNGPASPWISSIYFPCQRAYSSLTPIPIIPLLPLVMTNSPFLAPPDCRIQTTQLVHFVWLHDEHVVHCRSFWLPHLKGKLLDSSWVIERVSYRAFVVSRPLLLGTN